ncbi:MAG: tRNA pseudouridine synthase A, partial [Clostridia bacterium]|nr:tRNA pseudouridine synthase A [Clostridia bacterium]
MRIKLTVEYDGTNYAGWQRQENALAVQQVLEMSLSKLLARDTPVAGASRTDAGVHALGQAAHFDAASSIPPEKYAFALNAMLPPDIRVCESKEVAPGFHARFSSTGKLYRYVMYDRRQPSALYRNMCAHSIYPLDEALMN